MSNQTEPPKIVEKVWGREVWLVNGEQYCAKRLTVNPGWRCSMHRHPRKDETFIVESGYGWALVEDDPIELLPGTIVEVPPNTWHMFWCPAGHPTPLVFLEVSTHHDDQDVVRHSESAPLKTPLRVPET